jgi:hypothetical protein
LFRVVSGLHCLILANLSGDIREMSPYHDPVDRKPPGVDRATDPFGGRDVPQGRLSFAVLWAVLLSGPVLVLAAGVALITGAGLAGALVLGAAAQSLFVLCVLALILVSARNHRGNARDRAQALQSDAPRPYRRALPAVGRGADPFGPGPGQVPGLTPGIPSAAEGTGPVAGPLPHWWVFPARPGLGVDLAAACIARPSEQTRQVCGWLSAMGYDAHNCVDLAAMLGSVADMPERWALVVIDLDHLGPIETIVEDLFEFRDTCPAVPVILIASDVARDDLSAGRLSIADAMLAKPVSAWAFVSSLPEARDNNDIWNGKVRAEAHLRVVSGGRR